MKFILLNIEPLIVILTPLLIFLKFETIYSFLRKNKIISSDSKKFGEDAKNYLFIFLLLLVAIYFDIRWAYYNQNFDTILLYSFYYLGVLLFEISFEGAERILFPYSIFVIYLLICTAAQTGSFTHTNKDGSRDKRFKNNSYVHSFDSSTRELYNHIAVQTLFSLIIFLIIDIIFL